MMRTVIFVWLSVIILILSGCNGEKDCAAKSSKCVEDWNDKDVRKIVIYKKDSSGNKGVTGIVQDRKQIETFIKAIQTADPMPGALKASPPDYEAEFVLKDDRKAPPSIQLWLSPEGGGMIMYSNNTSQGYTLTKEHKEELKVIIESVKIRPSN
ncbi:hypothetical protein [Paenibacillus sp. MBLB4367]|uniref:hypothetical protein n=1 Tax=Paenibacillus sp. MBLB4367 TaxID=3384767 RepID=UPI00390825CF